jgi:hypothetical protein
METQHVSCEVGIEFLHFIQINSMLKLPPPYLYQKDERALPGNLQSRNMHAPLSHYFPQILFFSLSLFMPQMFLTVTSMATPLKSIVMKNIHRNTSISKKIIYLYRALALLYSRGDHTY